jgi:predicted phosphodiesterase
MNKPQTLLAVLAATLLLAGCDLIEYHPYDVGKDGPVLQTRTMCERIEKECAGKDTIRFAQVSDTQRWYDETKDFVKAINARGDIDFVVHTGDQTDFGLAKEFVWQNKILNKLSVPWVCVIGNHDCLGTGEDEYERMYGESNYSFNASFVHVVCLNTNAFEFDHSSNIPDFNFLKNDIDSVKPDIRCTVVAMHAMPGSEQFDNNVKEYFNYTLNKYPYLRFCIGGHDHHTEVEHPFENGVPYYECGNVEKRTYLVFTITKDNYTYEAVTF